MSTPAPARPHSRDAIRAAAERLFAGGGYAATSVRDIAASAGVDAALVIRHFGSKEQLFLETMRVEFDEIDLGGPIDTLGERLIRSLLHADDHVRGVYLALVRASDAGEVSSALRAAHDAGFVAPLAARLVGEDADLRARLAAALIGGLFYGLWIVRDEVLLSTPHDELARRYGRLLQHLLTG
jgi:AcrR family transcriptional regulator